MAQEAPATEGSTPDANSEPKENANTPQAETSEPPTFDKEYVSSLRSEAAKWRIEAQQRQEKLEELEERDKSELEKAQGKVAKLEQRAAEAERQLLRFQVANETQLPKELVSRLRGDTLEELQADAKELLALVKSRPESQTEPDFDGGAREPAPEANPESGFNDTALAVLGLKPN